jgi:hypothetical protein
MPDIFISYSNEDKNFADFLYNHLTAEKMTVFEASVSLQPGQQWSREILQNLRNSTCVIFLASKAACQSPYVQQEIGASVISGKNLIPVVWDIPPDFLPGWANQYQAINLAKATIDDIKLKFSEIANRLKMDKTKGYIIAALLVIGFLFLITRD